MCANLANVLQQGGQAGVVRGIHAENEPHPVPARLDLTAFAGPAASRGERLPEPFRSRWAEFDGHSALLHEATVTNPDLA